MVSSGADGGCPLLVGCECPGAASMTGGAMEGRNGASMTGKTKLTDPLVIGSCDSHVGPRLSSTTYGPTVRLRIVSSSTSSSPSSASTRPPPMRASSTPTWVDRATTTLAHGWRTWTATASPPRCCTTSRRTGNRSRSRPRRPVASRTMPTTSSSQGSDTTSTTSGCPISSRSTTSVCSDWPTSPCGTSMRRCVRSNGLEAPGCEASTSHRPAAPGMSSTTTPPGNRSGRHVKTPRCR